MTMPMDINPKYITDDKGEKLSVILSIEEFENILEDLKDLSIVAERKNEKLVSHQDVLDELKKDGIIWNKMENISKKRVKKNW